MTPIDYKYSNLLASRFDKFTVKSTKPYRANMRCCICGDSKKSETKARAWILEKPNNTIYYCHNCNASYSLIGLLKTHFNDLYEDYLSDRLFSNNLKIEVKEKPSKIEKTPYKIKLRKISQLPHNHPAKEYILQRRIPFRQHYRLYYAPKFNKWVNTLIPEKLSTKYDEPRLVIPFFDKENNFFGFTGRSFSPNSSLRYLSIMLDENRSKIFGLDGVDMTKPYYVVEGPIDSMFLSNAVAMAGADLKLDALENIENVIFVFDNEPRNKEIVQKMEKVIDVGHKIVLLNNSYRKRGKDLNDLILSGMSPDLLEATLSDHIYNGLEAKLKFVEWKKINA